MPAMPVLHVNSKEHYLQLQALKIKQVQAQHNAVVSLLRPLCLTRVLCRGPALKHILSNLEYILQALEEYSNSSAGEASSKAQGFVQQIGHGNFVIALKMAVSVLTLFENLNASV